MAVLGQTVKLITTPGFAPNKEPLSIQPPDSHHYVIVTYWHSLDAHERSHANDLFKKKFAKLAAMCSETKELGYDMLWQGAAEGL